MEQKTKNLIYGIGGAVLLAGGAASYFLTGDRTKESEKVSAVPSQSLSISTTGEVPLTFQMASATVDMCATKKRGAWFENDLLDPQSLEHHKSLGFQIWWVFVDGALTNIAYPNTTGTGKGYNARLEDFANQREYDEYGGGILTGSYTSDFTVKTFEFCTTAGVKSAVSLNKKATWEQNYWLIKQSTSKYIKLSSEVNTSSWSYTDYLNWANRTCDSIVKYFPDYYIIADEPTLFKSNRKSLEWRKYVNPTSLPKAKFADTYWQVCDEVGLTTDQPSNMSKINTFFNDSVPSHIAKFKELFPGWKIVAGECHVVDNGREGTDTIVFINKSITGVFAWGRFYEMFIKNQDIQPLAIQMSMKALSDPEDHNTKIIKRLNSLLVPSRKVTTLTFSGLEGCTGWSAREGKSHYVAINNSSLNTYTLSEVYVDTKKKTPTFTAVHHTARDWNSEVTIDSVSATNFTITPGVTVLNFTLK